MRAGDIIRVERGAAPSVCGRRYKLLRIEDHAERGAIVWAKEADRLGRALGITRAFPAERCHVDRKATKVARAEVER